MPCPERTRGDPSHDPPLLPALPAALHRCRRGLHHGLPQMRRVTSTDQLGEQLGLPSAWTRGPPARAPPSSRRVSPRPRAGPSTTVSDHHMRILRHVARQSQRELERHDAVDHAGDAASTGRRDYLARAATRTRPRVADAEQRRNRRPRGHRDTQSPPGSAPRLAYPTAGQPADGRPVTSASRSAQTPASVATAPPSTSARKARP